MRPRPSKPLRTPSIAATTRARPAFPAGQSTRRTACPLETQPVAVALTVRPAGLVDRGARGRRGVRDPCPRPAGRGRRDRRQPVPSLDAAIAPGARDDDVVAACEHAAAAPLPRHTQAASERLRRLLRHRDIAGAETARVEVTRHEGRLRIRILLPDAVPALSCRPPVPTSSPRCTRSDPKARGADVSLGTV